MIPAQSSGATCSSSRVAGQRVPEGFVDQAEVGVPAVQVPAGEGRCQTQILLAATAEPAASVGTPQPGHPDPITDREPRDPFAAALDHPDHLVSRRDLGPFRREVALGQMKVGTADPATDDPDQQLVRAGLGNRPRDPSQRSGVDRAGLVHHPGIHAAIVVPPSSSGPIWSADLTAISRPWWDSFHNNCERCLTDESHPATDHRRRGRRHHRDRAAGDHSILARLPAPIRTIESTLGTRPGRP